ncbi:MAG: hypothetical protein M5U29_19140 [Anaerolineae bacterium]|nr:hypothetical protein [Anaerolineae bacterium]
MLKLANGRVWGEDAQDVKAEGRRELKTRQDENLVQQPAIFGQLALLVGLDAVQALQQAELLDLVEHCPVAGHCVVVGEGDDVQAAHFGLAQNVYVADVRLLVIG